MPIAASIRERIIAQLVPAMNAGAEKPGTIYRTRVEAFASGELPASVLFLVSSTPDRSGSTTTEHDVVLALEHLMAGEAPMDQALDPMLVYGVQAMFRACENNDLVASLEEGDTEWEIEPSYDNVAIAKQRFHVTIKTQAGNPAQEARR